MAIIEIPLSEKYQRPIIELYNRRALIDTGAVIPMLSITTKELAELFPGAQKLLEGHYIGGIGGNAKGDVYRLEEFKIGELIYAPFDVFVPDENVLKYPILLGAPLFHGMVYSFDTVTHKFIVDTRDKSTRRTFRLHELNGQLLAQIDDVLVQDTNLWLSDMPFGLWM